MYLGRLVSHALEEVGIDRRTELIADQLLDSLPQLHAHCLIVTLQQLHEFVNEGFRLRCARLVVRVHGLRGTGDSRLWSVDAVMVTYIVCRSK